MLIFNFDFISWLFLLKKCWFYYVQNVFLVLLPKPIISIWQHSTLCETIGPKYGPRFIHVSEVISPFFSAALISTLSWKLFFVQKSCFYDALGCGIKGSYLRNHNLEKKCWIILIISQIWTKLSYFYPGRHKDWTICFWPFTWCSLAIICTCHLLLFVWEGGSKNNTWMFR